MGAISQIELKNRIIDLEKAAKKLSDVTICPHIQCIDCKALDEQRQIRLTNIESKIAVLTELLD